MATVIAIVILCISAVAMYADLVKSVHHTERDCSMVILNMAYCLSYVTAGSTVKTPEGDCCPAVKSMLMVNCFYEALKSSAQSGVSLNVTKTLSLPSACNIKAPSLSNCGMSLGTAAAPGYTFEVQASTAVGEAPTMAAALGQTGALAPAPTLGNSSSAWIQMPTGVVYYLLLGIK